jgi:hypothetical protein
MDEQVRHWMVHYKPYMTESDVTDLTRSHFAIFMGGSQRKDESILKL